MNRPDFVTDEHLRFLDELRKSGSCNMFESPVHLKAMFGVTQSRAKEIFKYWWATFEER